MPLIALVYEYVLTVTLGSFIYGSGHYKESSQSNRTIALNNGRVAPLKFLKFHEENRLGWLAACVNREFSSPL